MGSKKKTKSKSKLFDWNDTKACYNTHPGLALGGGVVYGGSAHTPKVKDADIYVSLDKHAAFTLTDPWEAYQRTNVRFGIDDSYAPRDNEVPRFKKMVTYLCNQLQAGKKIHVGCIGGHGRTGLVLSAMAAEMGHKDAIQYVRAKYCKRAVESAEQVQFLMDNYGVQFAEANKIYAPLSSGLWEPTGTGYDLLVPPRSGTAPMPYKPYVKPTLSAALKFQEIQPMPSPRSLWKKFSA